MSKEQESAEIGIIGGTGVYDPNIFQGIREVKVFTPYGSPSHYVSVGQYNGRKIAFVPRHGRDHSIPPHKINYRANMYALKHLGVKCVISVSSVGSLRENLQPGMFVFPDQFIDRTKSRADTFYDGAQVAHVSSADPFCPEMRKLLASSASKNSVEFQDGSTYICIEGPRFSSRAESRLFRQWGADIVGMTLYPEVILAREAELCYACLGMVTDYDVWADKPVTADEVTKVMRRNVENAKKIILDVIAGMPSERKCSCGSALEGAML
jgi:5'-methylthioadenosine phosphorylase